MPTAQYRSTHQSAGSQKAVSGPEVAQVQHGDQEAKSIYTAKDSSHRFKLEHPHGQVAYPRRWICKSSKPAPEPFDPPFCAECYIWGETRLPSNECNAIAVVSVFCRLEFRGNRSQGRLRIEHDRPIWCPPPAAPLLLRLPARQPAFGGARPHDSGHGGESQQRTGDILSSRGQSGGFRRGLLLLFGQLHRCAWNTMECR